MSLHEEIFSLIQAEIERVSPASPLSPTTLALAIQARFNSGEIEPHIKYSSLEHLKQMSRRALSGRYDAESDENESHQQDMFSGHLQTRYPTPHLKGNDPVYKARETLTTEEIDWNIQQLRRSADSRLAHADALRAWSESRSYHAA